MVSVTVDGANLYLQAKQAGAASNYAYSLAATSANSGAFPAPSFQSTSGTLSGGVNQNAQGGTVYSYSITNGSNSGYDATGNMTNVSDSVMGTWQYGYDALNRLTSGNAGGGPYNGQYTCWTYDNFGNRLMQAVSSTPCGNNPTPSFWAHYSAKNQIVGATNAVNGYGYDAAGNVTNDGANTYLYDAEGHICAMHGAQGMIGYQYDADGNRVGKGTLTAMSCDLTVNGYLPSNEYVLDQSGGQMTEVAVNEGGAEVWQHTNVTADGTLIASYDTVGLHFLLNDVVGTRRAQTDSAGVTEQDCQSLPFGDQLQCTQNLVAPTEHHFTGKERDAESGLDYFEARYYSSNMGRFSSPDPSGMASANPDNPQSLNLYSYVLNNPLIYIDPTGLDCTGTEATANQTVGENPTPAGATPDCAKKDPSSGTPVPTIVHASGTVSYGPQGTSVTATFQFANFALFQPGNRTDGSRPRAPSAPSNVPPVGACTAASCHIPGYVRPKSCDVDACTPAEKAAWCNSAKATNAAINTAIGGDYTPFSTFIRFTPVIGKFLGPVYAAQSVMKAGVSYTSSYINSVCSQ